MSAGPFIRSRYEVGNGSILRTRVQPETELLNDGTVFNSAPTGAATLPWGMKIRPGKREVGIIPRSVTLVFEAGNEPPGYKPDSSIEVPILTPAAFAAFQTATSLTYLSNTATVIGFNNEDYNG